MGCHFVVSGSKDQWTSSRPVISVYDIVNRHTNGVTDTKITYNTPDTPKGRYRQFCHIFTLHCNFIATGNDAITWLKYVRNGE